MSEFSTESLVRYENQEDFEKGGAEPVVASMETIALKALHVDDGTYRSALGFG